MFRIEESTMKPLEVLLQQINREQALALQWLDDKLTTIKSNQLHYYVFKYNEEEWMLGLKRISDQ